MTAKKKRTLFVITIILSVIFGVAGYTIWFLMYAEDFNQDKIRFNNQKILVDRDRYLGLFHVPEEKYNADSIEIRITTNDHSPFYYDSQLCYDTTIYIRPPYKKVRIPVGQKQSFLGFSRTYYTFVSLTFLPIIDLKYSKLGDKEHQDGCRINIYYDLDSVITSDALIKHRGNSSKMHKLEKRSYGLKLINEDGKKKNLSLLGMRNDNNWILDPLATDRAKMRDRVNFDIWEEFSTPPYQKQYEPQARNSISGRFVEVFCNNKYHGIYCLKEKIDGKQLKLKSSENGKIHGILYKNKSQEPKGKVIAALSFLRGDGSIPLSKSNWTIEYPKDATGENLYKPLAQVIKFLNESSAEEFATLADEYLDLPVWTDMFIFIQLIYAIDNIKNNNYLYFYDIEKSLKLGVALWDMDTTWDNDAYYGRHFSAYHRSLLEERIQKMIIFDRLMNDYPNFESQVRSRWAELRTSYFTYDNLMGHFNKYFQIYELSGAGNREERIWSMPRTTEGKELNIPFVKRPRKSNQWTMVMGDPIDIKIEKEFLKGYIQERLDAMDKKYGYDSQEK